jgi:hypothetical protein
VVLLLAWGVLLSSSISAESTAWRRGGVAGGGCSEPTASELAGVESFKRCTACGEWCQGRETVGQLKEIETRPRYRVIKLIMNIKAHHAL